MLYRPLDDITDEKKAQYATYESTRLADAFDLWEDEDDKPTLFGTDGITPSAVHQGALGDCWLLSSLASIAEFPGFIEGMFPVKELNTSGFYAMNMYSLGMPHTIIVDDFFPVQTGYNESLGIRRIIASSLVPFLAP